ncbi:dihydrofolate reductase [Clostridium sp. A1-XYC3]|uniref:Dihydrofolate reductase n=1 Tax=Clostridium tanneri TaxID=3037988 RepID=A0ABU4JRX6_9CLOT|nr:dihydrofolate reductase [Clostridium sp. A1-XYC3]MDW8800906.1 dihydrofolate reductase [Clostridium sp. A1-XYC3]
MLSYVVAMDKNSTIGKDNALPWYLPKDLEKFKEITTKGTKTMIMGRKTFESLPKILPDRHHIVITRDKNFRINDNRVTVINSIEELTPLIEDNREYFVIGGGEIFALLLPFTEKMYITKIDKEFQGDTYFPKYEENKWKILMEEEGIVDEENRYSYRFLILQRICNISSN